MEIDLTTNLAAPVMAVSASFNFSCSKRFSLSINCVSLVAIRTFCSLRLISIFASERFYRKKCQNKRLHKGLKLRCTTKHKSIGWDEREKPYNTLTASARVTSVCSLFLLTDVNLLSMSFSWSDCSFKMSWARFSRSNAFVSSEYSLSNSARGTVKVNYKM